MEPHGVLDDAFDDLCEQLDATGKGTVTGIQMGKFFQIADQSGLLGLSSTTSASMAAFDSI